MASYNAGIVTAYGAAVRGGYTGTYEQFCSQQANYAQTAAEVEQAKQDAQAAVQQAQDIADSIPEDYSQLSEDVSDLKEDISPLYGYSNEYYLHDILNDVTFDTGLYNKNGSYNSSGSYKHTNRIPVKEGDCVRVNAAKEARIVTAYYQGVANESLGAEYVSKYVVPANVDEVILSFLLANVPTSEFYLNSKDKLPALSEYWYSTNLLDVNALTVGSISKTGSISGSTTYKYTDYIQVNEGDKLIGIYSTDIMPDQSDTFRVVTAYDINKTPISAKGAEEVISYTVPEGVACVRITIYASRLTADYRIVKDRYYSYEPYSKNVQPKGTGENALGLFNILNRPLSYLPSYVTNALSYRPVGKLTKPYICLSTDDGAHELATYTIPMLITKQVPATLYLMKDSLVFDNPSETAVIVDAINNHGCELGQHGGRSWLNRNELALNDFFDSETAFFNTLELTAKSAACPGGYSTPMINVVAGGRFGAHCNGYGETEVLYYPYYLVGSRSNLYGLTRVGVTDYTLAENKTRLDYAVAHNLIYCVYWHDNSLTDAKKEVLEGLIDYAKSLNVEFCTVGEIATLTQSE